MSDLLNKILSETPLKTRIQVLLEMDDTDNWDNGTYFGDQEELAKMIVEIVEEWQLDGAELND